MLKFSNENAKTQQVKEFLHLGKGKRVYSFSLPAGYTCKGAEKCLSYANRITGKINDGDKTEFRCFAASLECQYVNVRKQVWHNYDQFLHTPHASWNQLILDSLPDNAGCVRVHVSGDFFHSDYFEAWVQVAKLNPSIVFYGYTKMPQYLAGAKLPSNFIFTSSYGGKYDYIIDSYNLKYCKVVMSEQEAIDNGLELDHNEQHALMSNKSFAVLIHGTQPANTKASKAKIELKKAGWTGYNKEMIALSLQAN